MMRLLAHKERFYLKTSKRIKRSPGKLPGLLILKMIYQVEMPGIEPGSGEFGQERLQA